MGELPYERGVTVGYETIRTWTAEFGPRDAAERRRREAPPGRTRQRF